MSAFSDIKPLRGSTLKTVAEYTQLAKKFVEKLNLKSTLTEKEYKRISRLFHPDRVKNLKTEAGSESRDPLQFRREAEKKDELEKFADDVFKLVGTLYKNDDDDENVYKRIKDVKTKIGASTSDLDREFAQLQQRFGFGFPSSPSSSFHQPPPFRPQYAPPRAAPEPAPWEQAVPPRYAPPPRSSPRFTPRPSPEPDFDPVKKMAFELEKAEFKRLRNNLLQHLQANWTRFAYPLPSEDQISKLSPPWQRLYRVAEQAVLDQIARGGPPKEGEINPKGAFGNPQTETELRANTAILEQQLRDKHPPASWERYVSQMHNRVNNLGGKTELDILHEKTPEQQPAPSQTPAPQETEPAPGQSYQDLEREQEAKRQRLAAEAAAAKKAQEDEEMQKARETIRLERERLQREAEEAERERARVRAERQKAATEREEAVLAAAAARQQQQAEEELKQQAEAAPSQPPVAKPVLKPRQIVEEFLGKFSPRRSPRLAAKTTPTKARAKRARAKRKEAQKKKDEEEEEADLQQRVEEVEQIHAESETQTTEIPTPVPTPSETVFEETIRPPPTPTPTLEEQRSPPKPTISSRPDLPLVQEEIPEEVTFPSTPEPVQPSPIPTPPPSPPQGPPIASNSELQELKAKVEEMSAALSNFFKGVFAPIPRTDEEEDANVAGPSSSSAVAADPDVADDRSLPTSADLSNTDPQPTQPLRPSVNLPGNVKFEVPRSPLDEEDRLRKMMAPEREQKEQRREILERFAKGPPPGYAFASPGFELQAQQTAFQEAYQESLKEADETFAEDFRIWLQQAYQPEATLKEKSVRNHLPRHEFLFSPSITQANITAFDRDLDAQSRVPWTKWRPLPHDPTVKTYLDKYVDKRAEFEKRLIHLIFRGPQNIAELFYYFKFVIRKEVATPTELGRFLEAVPMWTQ